MKAFQSELIRISLFKTNQTTTVYKAFKKNPKEKALPTYIMALLKLRVYDLYSCFLKFLKFTSLVFIFIRNPYEEIKVFPTYSVHLSELRVRNFIAAF